MKGIEYFQKKFLIICLEILLIFRGILWELFRVIFLGANFWGNFLGGFFWEDFLVGFFWEDFLGGILWEELLKVSIE